MAEFAIERGATINIGGHDFDKVKMYAKFDSTDMPKMSHDELAEYTKKFLNEHFDASVLVMRDSIARQLVEDRMRFTEKDGKFFAHVTSILDFIAGFPSYPDGVGARGTILHSYMERWGNTGQKDRFTFKEMMEDFPELAPEFKQVVDAGLSLEAAKCPQVIENIIKEGWEVVETEQKVFNDEHQYCGSFDGVFKKGEVYAMGDYKSGSDFSDRRLNTTFKQVAGYAKSDYIREKYKITKLLMIPMDVVNKTKVKEIKETDDIDMRFSLFLEDRARVRKELKV